MESVKLTGTDRRTDGKDHVLIQADALTKNYLTLLNVNDDAKESSDSLKVEAKYI